MSEPPFLVLKLDLEAAEKVLRDAIAMVFPISQTARLNITIDAIVEAALAETREAKEETQNQCRRCAEGDETGVHDWEPFRHERRFVTDWEDIDV